MEKFIFHAVRELLFQSTQFNLNPLVPNTPFLYPMKTLENLTVLKTYFLSIKSL